MSAQKPHTALAESNEGTRVGRLFFISGQHKAGWQPYLLWLVSGWGLGYTLENMSFTSRKG